MAAAPLTALRFNSDPNAGGGEKIMVSLPTGGLVASKPSVHASDISPTLMDVSHVVAPISLLQVKGWTRSLALYAVMAACYEEEELLKARYYGHSFSGIFQVLRSY